MSKEIEVLNKMKDNEENYYIDRNVKTRAEALNRLMNEGLFNINPTDYFNYINGFNQLTVPVINHIRPIVDTLRGTTFETVIVDEAVNVEWNEND